ncbi:C40 family peptidase [Paenibacillus sp. GYB003]|uniref:C40 family peptidase n=1 Tax=Paenibacillus sp. GYB003 TaxID=2994392 RepID=UPI002F96A5EF
MKRLWKTVFLSCAVWVSASALWSANASANDEAGVKIQVNDRLVEFPEAPPIIDGGQTLVPMRPVFEAMGYRLDWQMDGGQVTVRLQDAAKKKTVEAKTGTNEWVVDGKQVKLASGAQNRQGTVYVPLRLVSETLGYIVQWDNDNQIAIIGLDGKYHAPAWYAPPKVAAYTPTVAELVTAKAKSMLGIRYVWGGTTPGGFDCSGFVGYLYGQYGIDLPRTALDMYDSAGQSVVGLQAGDLVFFKIGKSTTHVGIYLGDGQFVSATTSAGTKIDSISSSYWGPKFIGAKRVL